MWFIFISNSAVTYSHASFSHLLSLLLSSFVAGSDGYVYEGRGWLWQGAHTKGYNSKGYGVAFIGDYMTNLPSQHTMDLVRIQLATCATEGGRLVSNYTIHGHRQLVNTSCPGDAFYNEIKKWEHFGVRDEVTGLINCICVYAVYSIN